MAMTEEKFNCFKCQNNPRRTDEQIEYLKDRKGCYGSSRVMYGLGDYQLSTCVGNLTTPDFEHIMFLYDHYDKGHMPYPGGPQDQPNKLVEIFNLIYNLTEEHKEKLRREAERASRKK